MPINRLVIVAMDSIVLSDLSISDFIIIANKKHYRAAFTINHTHIEDWEVNHDIFLKSYVHVSPAYGPTVCIYVNDSIFNAISSRWKVTHTMLQSSPNKPKFIESTDYYSVENGIVNYIDIVSIVFIENGKYRCRFIDDTYIDQKAYSDLFDIASTGFYGYVSEDSTTKNITLTDGNKKPIDNLTPILHFFVPQRLTAYLSLNTRPINTAARYLHFANRCWRCSCSIYADRRSA